MSRSTRGFEVRIPCARSRAQTLRCPSPIYGEVISTCRPRQAAAGAGKISRLEANEISTKFIFANQTVKFSALKFAAPVFCKAWAMAALSALVESKFGED